MQPLKVEPGVGKPVDGENIGDSTFILGSAGFSCKFSFLMLFEFVVFQIEYVCL